MNDTNYRHKLLDGTPAALPIGKAVCVGRNYAAHIAELKNETPSEPVLFLKPGTSLRGFYQNIVLPKFQGHCHHELELAVVFDKVVHKARAQEVEHAIYGYALALDLTLRDVQAELKKYGLPWEMAKAFDGSCPVSPIIPKDAIPDPDNLSFKLTVNGKPRQEGNTQMMLWKTFDLIAYISQYFTLLPGDMVLTGTPAGVGPLKSGDRLEAELEGKYRFETTVED